MNLRYYFWNSIGTFTTGYGGGFSIVLSLRNIQDSIDWVTLGFFPIMSGAIALFPFIGKIFQEKATESKAKNN